METRRESHDTLAPHPIAAQAQVSSGASEPANPQFLNSTSPRPQRAQSAEPRRSKADALRIAQRLKRTILVGALLTFGSFSVAIGGHLASTAAAQTSTSRTTASSSDGQTTTSGSYFSQQSGGSTNGNSNSSSSSSSAVSGSSVS